MPTARRTQLRVTTNVLIAVVAVALLAAQQWLVGGVALVGSLVLAGLNRAMAHSERTDHARAHSDRTDHAPAHSDRTDHAPAHSG